MDSDRWVVNISSASRHRLDTRGVFTLTAKIATKVARVPFIVVRNLGADALLDCSYVDKHVRTIEALSERIELDDGAVVPIIWKRA